MKLALKKKIETFVESTIVGFHERRAANLEKLRLSEVLKAKNPYLFRAKNLELASDLIKGLLDARLSSSEEGSFGMFMENLAVFVAEQTCGGEKSSAEGLDIELIRDKVRYLIAVKSGKNWGNSTQHARLGQNFATAVKRLRQNKVLGEIQPTLGICYGNFKTTNNGKFLHIGGQSFWHLISGDADFYTAMIEPLGHQADRFNEEFELKKKHAYNRMTKEFMDTFCDSQGVIEWKRVVQFTSQNMAD